MKQNSDRTKAQQTPSRSEAQREFLEAARGCAIVLGLILLPYVLNAVYILGGNFINQSKWHSRGSAYYIETATVNSFEARGTSTVTLTVKNGKVIHAQNAKGDFTEEITNLNFLTDTPSSRCLPMLK